MFKLNFLANMFPKLKLISTHMTILPTHEYDFLAETNLLIACQLAQMNSFAQKLAGVTANSVEALSRRNWQMERNDDVTSSAFGWQLADDEVVLPLCVVVV